MTWTIKVRLNLGGVYTTREYDITAALALLVIASVPFLLSWSTP